MAVKEELLFTGAFISCTTPHEAALVQMAIVALDLQEHNKYERSESNDGIRAVTFHFYPEDIEEVKTVSQDIDGKRATDRQTQVQYNYEVNEHYVYVGQRP